MKVLFTVIEHEDITHVCSNVDKDIFEQILSKLMKDFVETQKEQANNK